MIDNKYTRVWYAAILICGLFIITPAKGQKWIWRDQRAPEVEEAWYFNGSEWRMATTSWLGTVDTSQANAANYSNGLPVAGDDLLFPENAQRAMLTDMDTFLGTKGFATLTLTANPSAGETITIRGGTSGTEVYEFVSTLTACSAGDVLIGATASDSLDNLIAAINLAAGAGSTYCAGVLANTYVTAVAGAGDTMVITALFPGTISILIILEESLANGSWVDFVSNPGTKFDLNLIFIGSGHTFDIGDLANPFYGSAFKIVHQGTGELFFKAIPNIRLGDTVIVNSDNRTNAANFNGTSASGVWSTSFLKTGVFTKGKVIFQDQISFDILIIGFLDNPISDVDVVYGTSVNAGGAGTLFMFGGTATLASVPGKIVMGAGTLMVSGSQVEFTVIQQLGGRINYNSSLAIQELDLLGGVFDVTSTTEKLTIGILRKSPDPISTLLKSDDLVTITTRIDFTGGDTP